jgi:hypothetical protein
MYNEAISNWQYIVDFKKIKEKTRVTNQIEQLSFAIDLRHLSDLYVTRKWWMCIIQKVNKLHSVQCLFNLPRANLRTWRLICITRLNWGRSLHINSQCVRDVDNQFVTLNSTKWRISFVLSLSLRNCKKINWKIKIEDTINALDGW